MAEQTTLNKTHKKESLDNTHRALLLNDKMLMPAHAFRPAGHYVTPPVTSCQSLRLIAHDIFRAAHAGDVPQSVLPDAA